MNGQKNSKNNQKFEKINKYKNKEKDNLIKLKKKIDKSHKLIYTNIRLINFILLKYHLLFYIFIILNSTIHIICDNTIILKLTGTGEQEIINATYIPKIIKVEIDGGVATHSGNKITATGISDSIYTIYTDQFQNCDNMYDNFQNIVVYIFIKHNKNSNILRFITI